LGIGAAATAEDAKRAYRACSKKYHPDAGGSHLAFVALQNAYGRVKDWLELTGVAS
jgi:DnaJ-class molecular chaperone